METKKEVIKNYLQLRESYEHKVNPGVAILERCNKIIKVDDMTVGLDDNNYVTLENRNFPMQFADETVNKIVNLKFLRVTGGRITPKVYTVKEYYAERLAHVNALLAMFNL